VLRSSCQDTAYMHMEWVNVPINDTYLLFTIGPKGMNLFANRSRRNDHMKHTRVFMLL
jgi:hypothetical protein